MEISPKNTIDRCVCVHLLRIYVITNDSFRVYKYQPFKIEFLDKITIVKKMWNLCSKNSHIDWNFRWLVWIFECILLFEIRISIKSIIDYPIIELSNFLICIPAFGNSSIGLSNPIKRTLTDFLVTSTIERSFGSV